MVFGFDWDVSKLTKKMICNHQVVVRFRAGAPDKSFRISPSYPSNSLKPASLRVFLRPLDGGCRLFIVLVDGDGIAATRSRQLLFRFA